VSSGGAHRTIERGGAASGVRVASDDLDSFPARLFSSPTLFEPDEEERRGGTEYSLSFLRRRAQVFTGARRAVSGEAAIAARDEEEEEERQEQEQDDDDDDDDNGSGATAVHSTRIGGRGGSQFVSRRRRATGRLRAV
jgi:hypothetical protein